jgi:hypothetical protein
MKRMTHTELTNKAKQIWDSWLCGYSFRNAWILSRLIFKLAKKEKEKRK